MAIFCGSLSFYSCSRPAKRAPDEVKLIPRAALLGNPDKMRARISPDGARLAYVEPKDGVLNVWVRTIGQTDDRVVTNDTNRGIRTYYWAYDNTHILYLQDIGGDENWRLYGVNLETGDFKDYTPYEKVQVQIVDLNKHFPNEMILMMNKDNPQFHDPYHLDLTTGEIKKIGKNPGNFVGWLTDADFILRGAMAATPDGGFDMMVRDSAEAEWRNIIHWDSENAMTSGPICFSKDGKSLVLLDSRDANTGRVVRYTISNGNMEVIAEDTKYDAGGTLIHPDSYEVQAVSFTRARREWKVLDESIERDFRAIKELDRGDFSVVDRDNADDTWLVAFDADIGPVAYYAFDRKSKSGRFLFHHRPELNNYQLAVMEPMSFTSRDGLTIHGYITYPPGKGRGNLPMVLNVHGGPWHRDVWGYNSEAQWLANRGYACLQVNFRGSTGYGKDFVNAGDREWGGKMHDDLEDAVDWAIAKGIADPAKVAIYGGSYGGYAALAGAAFTPDLFCCAVAIVGPSNLITFINTIPPYWKPMIDMFHKRLGSPEKDEEFLKSRSPLFQVDNIKIPMLIAQGANDPRVNQDESEQIVAAMAAKGIEYEYLLYPDEGHGFAKPENRVSYYAAAEKFFARHMGGRYEEADAEVQAKLKSVTRTIEAADDSSEEGGSQ